MISRMWVGLAVVALSASALSGCTTDAATCVSWVDFPDAQSMYDEAVLVVAGTAAAADGSVELVSGRGELHTVTIDAVYKGELDGTAIRAASPRDYCVADPPYPSDDPIPTGARVLLFLRPAAGMPADLDEVAEWSTLTPLAGVLPFDEGSELPFEPGTGSAPVG